MRISTLLIIILLILTSLNVANAFILTDKENLRACNNQCGYLKKEAAVQCLDNYDSCLAGCEANNSCKRDCSKEKNICIRNAGVDFRECQKQCRLNMKKGCLNETYKAGESFIQGCEICTCQGDNKVRCKREAFCNMNVTVSKQDCTSGGGFYQALCNGPYFDIVCSQQKFCICGGTGDYNCPEDYSCLHDFISPNKRVHTISGWKNLLGQSLGDVGVCGKN